MGCTCKEGGETCGYCQMLSTAPRLTSLREYARHKGTCAIHDCVTCAKGFTDHHKFVKGACDCGLDALLSVPSPQPESSRAQVIEKLTKAASWETGPLETKQLIDEALALLQQEGTT